MFVLPSDLIIFDLEVCGLPQGLPEIVDLGAVHVNQELEIVDSFEMLVKPDRLDHVDSFFTELTGIKKGDLKGQACWAESYRPWAEFTNWDHGVLAAWGSHFDVGMLREQYRRSACPYPHQGSAFCVKSMVYGMGNLIGMRPGGWGISSICKRLEIDPVLPIHRGLTDAKTALLILREMADMTCKVLEQG
jgi:DNA polymerase III alpha subunit (gram-positive type)